MLILIEILFLIFGFFFNKNVLLIATLVLSSVWILATLFFMSQQKEEFCELLLLLRIICFALSIVFLVI